MAAHWEKHEFCVKFHVGGPTSSVWRKDARGLREGVANEVPVVDGCEGPPLSPPFKPSDGHYRRVGRKTSVRRFRRYRSQSSKKRHGSSHWEPDPTRTPGGGRNSDAQHGKEVTPEAVSLEDDRSPIVSTKEKATVICTDVLPQWQTGVKA